MIKANDCPFRNTDWYDVTDIETAKQGKNAKVCTKLGCEEDCNRQVITDGLPFYDLDGAKLKSLTG